MEASKACLDLIKAFEGFSSQPYLCPAGYWTRGYGSLCKRDSPAVTHEEAELLLSRDIQVAERGVSRLVHAELTQGQFDALVSFTFNLGLGNLRASSLRMYVNAGDFAEAAEEFGKWVYAGGRKLPGLVRRREMERKLFTQ